MKPMTKIKLNRFIRRSNDWINDVLCYPVNRLERYMLMRKRAGTCVYNWIEVK